MAEYIERETALSMREPPKSNREYQTDNLDDAYGQGWDDALCCLEHIPAADVAPVVHARWIDAPWLYYGAKPYVCSRCRNDKYWRKRDLHFKEPHCPNCGAKMDGGDSDE